MNLPEDSPPATSIYPTMKPKIQNRAHKRPSPTTTPMRTLNCSKTLKLPPLRKRKAKLHFWPSYVNKEKIESINNSNDHERIGYQK